LPNVLKRERYKMPASGSAISGTVAHKHQADGATGGPLDANSITEFSSTSAGSLIYFDASSQATNLNAGNSGDTLTMGASLPAWSAGGAAGSWVELINERDNAAANTFDTGYIDCGSYRVLDIFYSAYLSSGTDPFDIRVYDPDGVPASAATQGAAGMVGNTFYQNGNLTSLQLSFGQSLATGRSLAFGMRAVCSPVGRPSGGATSGTFWITQRKSYDASFITGNFVLVDGFTATDLMFINGLQDQSSNTWTDGILTVYGAGDNTT